VASFHESVEFSAVLLGGPADLALALAGMEEINMQERVEIPWFSLAVASDLMDLQATDGGLTAVGHE
jgi:hypothetical protein